MTPVAFDGFKGKWITLAELERSDLSSLDFWEIIVENPLAIERMVSRMDDVVYDLIELTTNPLSVNLPLNAHLAKKWNEDGAWFRVTEDRDMIGLCRKNKGAIAFILDEQPTGKKWEKIAFSATGRMTF